MRGAPRFEFDQDIADEICARLARGQSLRKIVASGEDFMPSLPTIYRWIREHASFADQYARAREDQADHYADEIVEIADTAHDTESAQVARVRIDARKWTAGKLRPKKYGERVALDHAGSIAITASEMTDEELARVIGSARRGEGTSSAP